MKKFLSITLCIVITAFLILTLTSCGKRNSMVHYNSTLADYACYESSSYYLQHREYLIWRISAKEKRCNLKKDYNAS